MQKKRKNLRETCYRDMTIPDRMFGEKTGTSFGIPSIDASSNWRTRATGWTQAREPIRFIQAAITLLARLRSMYNVGSAPLSSCPCLVCALSRVCVVGEGMRQRDGSARKSRAWLGGRQPIAAPPPSPCSALWKPAFPTRSEIRYC